MPGPILPLFMLATSTLLVKELNTGRRTLLMLHFVACVFPWRRCCTLRCDGRIGSLTRLERRLLAQVGISQMKAGNVSSWYCYPAYRYVA